MKLRRQNVIDLFTNPFLWLNQFMNSTFAVVFAQDVLGRGIAIAVTGMVIVFAALLLVTAFITVLPRMLNVFAQVVPEVQHLHAPQSPSPSPDLLPDDAVVAAIGFVLHTKIQRQTETGDSEGPMQ